MIDLDKFAETMFALGGLIEDSERAGDGFQGAFVSTRTSTLDAARDSLGKFFGLDENFCYPRVEGRRVAANPGPAKYLLLDIGCSGHGAVGASVGLIASTVLIEDGAPAWAGVLVVGKRLLYAAGRGLGSWKYHEDAKTRLITAAPGENSAVRVVLDPAMSSFDSVAVIELLQQRSVTLHRSGPLKFCAVAEGIADLHPGIGFSAAWDTAPGHLVVTEAGGAVVDANGISLSYSDPCAVLPPFLAGTSWKWLKEMDLVDFPARLSGLELDVCAISC